MKSVSIANRKGGVGKTTTASGLGGALRARGYLVGLLDLDPEACLSLMASGVDRVTPKRLPGMLRRLVSYDFCIIDTPPALSGYIEAAVNASDGVIIPVTADLLSLRGLGNLLGTIDQAKILGLCVIGYRGHVAHHRRVLEKLEELPYPVLARVPFSIASADAALIGRDVVDHRLARARGVAAAYQELAEEVIKWAKTIS